MIRKGMLQGMAMGFSWKIGDLKIDDTIDDNRGSNSSSR